MLFGMIVIALGLIDAAIRLWMAFIRRRRQTYSTSDQDWSWS